MQVNPPLCVRFGAGILVVHQNSAHYKREGNAKLLNLQVMPVSHHGILHAIKTGE